MLSALRTDEMEISYTNHKKTKGPECGLCGKIPLQAFKHWIITEALFPYNKIAKAHHMLLPIRHASEHELNVEEIKEMEEIKKRYVQENYDYMMEATHKYKSIPAHYHMHLLVMLV